MATWADRCLRPAVQRVELNYDAAVGRHMTAPASWTTRRLLLSRYGLVAVGDSVHSSLSCLSRYRETRYSGAVMTYFAKRRINEVSYIAQYFHDSYIAQYPRRLRAHRKKMSTKIRVHAVKRGTKWRMEVSIALGITESNSIFGKLQVQDRLLNMIGLHIGHTYRPIILC